jgi:hypothetical protein
MASLELHGRGGRLWLCNWGAQEVVAVDADGNSEVVVRVPTAIPFSIDWLPGGRLVIVFGPEGFSCGWSPTGRWSPMPI